MAPNRLGALQVGQRFDAAVLHIFDATLSALATYRLSSVRVKTVRSTGDTDAVALELVLSGKAVALTFP